MQGILIAQGASAAAAISNVFLKRCSDQPNRHAILFYFFLSSLGAALITSPSIFSTPFSLTIFSLGLLVGLAILMLFTCLTKALACGPMGLTFVFQNGGALLTPVVLFLLFGPAFSCVFTPINALGMLLVFIGLFWSAKDEVKRTSSSWLWYSLGALFWQGFILCIYQYRVLIFNQASLPAHPLLFFSSPIEADVWFMPGIFTMTTVVEGALFFRNYTPLHKNHLFSSNASGFFNGLVAMLLLLSTWYGSPAEKAFLFPSFAASTMIASTLLGALLFHERIVWAGVILAALGVFVGTL
jgi:hypothetical protein